MNRRIAPFLLLVLLLGLVYILLISCKPKQDPAYREEPDDFPYECRMGYIQPIGKGQLHFMESRQGHKVYGVWILTDSTNTPTDITVLHLYTEYNKTTWQDTLTHIRE